LLPNFTLHIFQGIVVILFVL